jgi:predicted PurR-regulated permease PerM
LPEPPTAAFANPEEIAAMLPAFLGITQGLLSLVAGLAVVLALSLYWSADQHRFERLWLSLLPAGRRAQVRDSWRTIESSIGAYLRSQTLQSLLAALLLGTGYWVLGLDFPVLLAVVAALTMFIPLLGGALMVFLAFLVGTLSGGNSIAIAAVVYTLVVLIFLEFVVEPRILPRHRSSTMLTILLLLPLIESFGLAGLVFAPLLASTIEVLSIQLFRAQTQRSSTAVHISQLEEKHRKLTAGLEQEPQENARLELLSLAQRLDSLLRQTREAGIGN